VSTARAVPGMMFFDGGIGGFVEGIIAGINCKPRWLKPGPSLFCTDSREH